MQYALLTTAFLALASSITALPSPQSPSLNCYSTCSTSCIQAGSIRGGLCSSDGTCTCLTGTGAKPRDLNLRDQIQCFETCSTDCENAGNIRGGLCSSDGICTCLTGEKKAKREPQSAEVQCYETCSTDCEQAGNIRGGLCSTDG